jgi:hypothetical protein
VVGGVAAELGGGKFANGGMSAAFSRMFNDLHINKYAGGKGNRFGHLGSAVNSNNTMGFYSKNGTLWGVGEMRPDYSNALVDSVVIKTTPGQDRMYQDYLDNLDVSYDLNYHLIDNSCVDVVRIGLEKIGILIEDSWTPSEFMDDLKEHVQ